MKLKSVAAIVLLAVVAVIGVTLSNMPQAPQVTADRPAHQPAAMQPFGGNADVPQTSGERLTEPADLTEPGAVAWGTTPAEIIDTTLHEQAEFPLSGEGRRIKELLPPHEYQRTLPQGPPNELLAGRTLDTPRAAASTTFPAIGDTGWTPPDPTHAIGPDHIVSTVNMSLAFYTKDGTLQYINELGEAGNPGFFEPLGAGGFTFDPKCFYDHLADRFVVLALETYGSTESWITFAVSDDSDPNGTWYKYRTDAVISVSGSTYWWDYPGFGYDGDAYYVTGNLFGLSSGGWAGVGFRVFDKTPLLVGNPAVYSTLRDGGAASVQVCQHFGSNQAPFFASTYSSTSLEIHAITNPVTSPSLTSTTVSVPYYGSPGSAPAAGGYTVSLVDDRIMNCHWRDGNLYAAHNISSGGTNLARWYHLDTNNWPASGAVSLVQSGNVTGGSGIHTWFPAIYSNAVGDVGLVCGSSSSSQRIAVNVTGRTATDPAGTMGSLTQVLLAPVNGGDRWGDYYDIAIDPVDDMTFWAIGEYPDTSGWSNWISSFTITIPSIPDTVSATIDATPSTGVLPFSSQFWVQLTNLTTENRRAAARIDVTIGNGTAYNNWRAGWTNLGPGEVFATNWNQNFPGFGSLVGNNVFEITAEDVTPAPYNQPPFSFSGDTDTASVTVTATN